MVGPGHGDLPLRITRRRAGHFLCPLESYEEGQLCLHAVHMVLRVEDGMGRDALNARVVTRQSPVDGAVRTWGAKSREPPRREGAGASGLRTAWSLVNETRTRWGGEFK